MGFIYSSLSLSPEQNISRYLHRIRTYPMLEAKLERELAIRWAENGDKEAMHQMVNSHLRLVAKIAMGYRGYGLPVGELISEGNIGMMQAVNKFDPHRGFRLSTYAMWWIRAAIQEYILHSWSMVKIGTTAAQKKLFFNLRKIKAELKAFDEGDLPPGQVELIARRLKVSQVEVTSMNRRLAKPDQSLNAPLRQDGEGDGDWQDWLVGDEESQETTLGNMEELHNRRTMLHMAMDKLNDRERHIVSERRLRDKPATLQQLSKHYGISRERVRQIEAKAFEKIQKSVRNTVIERAMT
jgi:RNA polymerase sigma-32 factor